MSFCPDGERYVQPASENVGQIESANAVGVDASFVCGAFIRFSFEIDDDRQIVSSCRIETDGCERMFAAAEHLANKLTFAPLKDLHGFSKHEFFADFLSNFQQQSFADERAHCLDAVVGGARAAFADHRARLIDEFVGETPLICTCFGVSEAEIVGFIESKRNCTVEEISKEFRAGSGCGSCRMVLQELIDSSFDHRTDML